MLTTNRTINRPTAPNWDAVERSFETGTRLKFDDLYQEALARILYEFPTELYAIDKIKHDLMISIEKGEYKAIDDILDGILWAKTTGYRRILPWAYLALMTEASSGSNNTNPLCDAKLKRLVKHGQKLPPEDRILIRRAYTRIMALQPDSTFQWFYSSQADKYQHCQTSDGCKKARVALCEKLMGRFAPIDQWSESWDSGMCVSCISIAKRLHEEGRWRLWSALPRTFDLPDWPVLVAEPGN